MTGKCVCDLRIAIYIILFAQNTSAQYTLLLQAGKFNSMSTYQPFEVVEVIDARADTATIGMVYHAGNKQTESIKTTKPLAEVLVPYFDACGLKSDKQTKIVLKINYLEFGYRKIKEREYVWAYCDYDVYTKKDNGIALIERQTAAVEGKASGYGLAMDIAKVNWLLWDDAFGQIKDVKLNNPQPELMPFAVLHQHISSPEIIFADTLYTGIYANYEEFIQNKPSINNYKLTKYNLTPDSKFGPKEWVFEIPDIEETGKFKKIKTSKIWGYCKNSRIYRRIDEKQFIEIEPLGTSFEVAGMAIKSYQMVHKTPQGKATFYGGYALGAYSRLYMSLPAQVAIVGATAVIAIIGKLASDPNQRAVITNKGWRPIPIYSLQ